MSPDLATALRANTPSAPATLYDRVAEITAARPPAPRFTLGRLAKLAAPATAGLALAVAAVVGLSSAIDNPNQGRESAGSAREQPGVTHAPARPERLQQPQTPAASDTARSSAPPASSGRAQDYRASLRLLVDGTDELSAATQRALRTTRRHGGYLVSVTYETPEPGEGTAAVRVKVPVSRVQAATIEFSELGRILAQDTRIADLQQPLDELTRRIRRLERRANAATGAERARILAEISQLRRERAEINRRAAFATVDLGLTTHEPKEPAATPGRLDRALDDAIGILLAELVIAAYILIVASPLLVLLAAGFFGNRAYRRHADQQLLERT